VTDAARNDPVSQRLFGGVVGERQQGLRERTQDDFPVVEEFAHDTAQGRMFIRLMHLAQVPQPFDLGGVALGQRLRRRIEPRRVDGRHQRGQDTFHLLPNPGHPAITRFGQPPQLAHQVRPAAQAVFPVSVDHVTIADENAGIAVLQGVLEHLPGAWADEVQHRRGADQRPQPQQHAGFRPRRFIDVQLRHLHDVGHQGVLQREAGTAGFPDRLIDHAGAQRQVEDFPQELANARS
jgi:hypothetical protein